MNDLLQPAAPARPLRGRLRLQFEADAQGRTILRSGFRTGLFHYAKPYHDGDLLAVQVVNPTAGIFEGDELESSFTAGDGARASVLSPSSTQVYSMPGKATALIRQAVSVSGGGSLSVMPKWLVPHKGARLRQSTSVQLEGDSSLLLFDLISAGRLHSGEFLEFEHLVSTTEIRREGRLLLRERLETGRDLNRWVWEGSSGRRPLIATAYAAFPGAAGACEETMRRLPAPPADANCAFGLTALDPGLAVLRIHPHVRVPQVLGRMG